MKQIVVFVLILGALLFGYRTFGPHTARNPPDAGHEDDQYYDLIRTGSDGTTRVALKVKGSVLKHAMRKQPDGTFRVELVVDQMGK
jgi:hypothetical protein